MKKLSILSLIAFVLIGCTSAQTDEIKVTTTDSVGMNQDNVWKYSFNEYQENEFEFYATEGQNPIVENMDVAIDAVKNNIELPECDSYYGYAIVEIESIPFPEGESTVGKAPLAKILEITKLENSPTCYN